MKKIEQERENVNNARDALLFLKRNENDTFSGLFSLGGSLSPSVLVEGMIHGPLEVMQTSASSTWMPLTSALEQVSSKLSSIESFIEAESNKALENAVQAGCEKNEIEKRVKLRNDIRETQKKLESILPSNGVAEVQVDDDGFYYIREQDDLPLGSETLISKESNISSTTHPVDWDNIMAKLNKFEEMEGGEGEGEREKTSDTDKTSSQKVRFNIEKKVEEQVPSILQSSSSIPFSGKITERSTSSTSSTQTLSRPKSLFAQMNRG
jgi:hypothetical protein